MAGEYEASLEPTTGKVVICSDHNQASGLHLLHKLGAPDVMACTWHRQSQIPSPVSSLYGVLGSGGPAQSLIQTASFITQIHPIDALRTVGTSPLSACICQQGPSLPASPPQLPVSFDWKYRRCILCAQGLVLQQHKCSLPLLAFLSFWKDKGVRLQETVP